MPEISISPEQRSLIQEIIPYLPSLRKKARLSQTEFGYFIGKSRQTVSAIERGESPMAWDTFLATIYIFKLNNVTNSIIDEDNFREKFNSIIYNK